jgi:hypothetical protein
MKAILAVIMARAQGRVRDQNAKMLFDLASHASIHFSSCLIHIRKEHGWNVRHGGYGLIAVIAINREERLRIAQDHHGSICTQIEIFDAAIWAFN